MDRYIEVWAFTNAHDRNNGDKAKGTLKGTGYTARQVWDLVEIGNTYYGYYNGEEWLTGEVAEVYVATTDELKAILKSKEDASADYPELEDDDPDD